MGLVGDEVALEWSRVGGMVWRGHLPNPNPFPGPICLESSTCTCARSSWPMEAVGAYLEWRQWIFPSPKEASICQNSPLGNSECHVDSAISLHGELQWIGLGILVITTKIGKKFLIISMLSTWSMSEWPSHFISEKSCPLAPKSLSK